MSEQVVLGKRSPEPESAPSPTKRPRTSHSPSAPDAPAPASAAPSEPSPRVHFQEEADKSKKGSKTGKKRSIRTRRWDGEKPKGGKRERTGSRNAEDAATVVGEASSAQDHEDKAPRLPKRQCALLMGFCGSGYNGMQIQAVYVFVLSYSSHEPRLMITVSGPGVRTIENTLFDALVRAGAVSKDNSDNPTKVRAELWHCLSRHLKYIVP